MPLQISLEMTGQNSGGAYAFIFYYVSRRAQWCHFLRSMPEFTWNHWQKSQEFHNHDRYSLDRDSNPGLPEWKAGMLICRSPRFVSNFLSNL
jgi:hypothetical protein